MTVLPGMTVEQRVGQSHGLPDPDLSAENMAKQIKETVALNNDAKYMGWRESTLDILQEYIPIDVTHDEIRMSVREVFGFNNWKECAVYVQKDMCSDFFNRCLSYCLDEQEVQLIDQGFIDGSGIGYLGVYRDRLKVTLEQCFDEKYFHKVKRPLEHLLGVGVDLVDTANFLHPGHWSYPAGHGTKFLTTIEVLRSVFTMSDRCSNILFIAACVLSMGRSGNLIHHPMDNLIGGKLTTLTEFS